MFIMLKEQPLNIGWKYGDNSGRPCAVNVNNIADMREVEVIVSQYFFPAESDHSGTPERKAVRCVAIMFTFALAEGDACVFYYQHTLDEVLTIIHETHMRMHEALERN